MAENMTYTSLQSDIKNYLERGEDAVSDPNVYVQIPRLIFMAQERLAKEAKTLISRVALTDNLTPGNPILTKPNRWRNPESFAIGIGPGFNEVKTLYLRNIEYCRAYWPIPAQTGEPLYYADYDFGNWLIVPTPTLAYPVEVIIQEKITPIDSTNGVNFYTEFAPDLLLHACLLEAGIFLKNDSLIAREQGWYDRLLASVNYEQKIRASDKSQTKSPGDEA